MSLRSIVTFVMLTMLIACSEASRKDLLPPNSGDKGELLVVAPSEIWSTTDADIIKDHLGKIMYGLPQDELLLKRIELKESGFTDMFKTHRNVLKIEIHPRKKTGVQVKRDVYARQQVFALVNLQSKDDLPKVLEDHAQTLLNIYHEAEIERLIERNISFGQAELNEEVRAHTDISINMQDKFQVAVRDSSFLWLRLDQSKPLGGYQHTISQGLLIYWRNYTDTNQFSDSSLYAWKSEVNQRFVSGPKNSYMSISKRYILPQSKLITFHGQTAKEVRGLWRMEGYFMGGPFYALAFYNPENGRQYMVEGYAYAPQFDKAPLIREIEAMAKSASPISEEQKEAID